MSARRIVIAATALAALAACVAVGRWERGHAVSRNVTAIDAVVQAVGGVGSRSLSGYRVDGDTCFFYAADGTPYAYQLCFTPDGRVVEAAHRDAASVRYWWLGWDPAAEPKETSRAALRSIVREVERASHS